MSNVFLSEVNETILDAKSFLVAQETQLKTKEQILSQIKELKKNLFDENRRFESMLRASSILGTVADEQTQAVLNKITETINSALGIMFKEDKRRISIKQVMFREYPHFIVELTTADGTKRTFKQSGTGLAQVVSFLFTIFLIEARKGRKIMVMDELLNGLHPDAKRTIKAMIQALSEDFQFVIVEYGIDIGKQYEIIKTQAVADVVPYVGQGYYKDTTLRSE